MKLKHWQGYGSVEAKKVSKTTFNNNWGEKKTKLVLSVKGNHEYGLVRDDIYDVKRWLFDRFEKNFSGEYYDIDMSIKDEYVGGVEVATYTFIY